MSFVFQMPQRSPVAYAQLCHLGLVFSPVHDLADGETLLNISFPKKVEPSLHVLDMYLLHRINLNSRWSSLVSFKQPTATPSKGAQFLNYWMLRNATACRDFQLAATSTYDGANTDLDPIHLPSAVALSLTGSAAHIREIMEKIESAPCLQEVSLVTDDPLHELLPSQTALFGGTCGANIRQLLLTIRDARLREIMTLESTLGCLPGLIHLKLELTGSDAHDDLGALFACLGSTALLVPELETLGIRGNRAGVCVGIGLLQWIEFRRKHGMKQLKTVNIENHLCGTGYGVELDNVLNRCRRVDNAVNFIVTFSQ